MKDKIKEHWEREETVSLKDENLRQLEVKAIAECIQDIDKDGLYICDMGCGDGANTISYSRSNKVKRILGIDYSSTMIKKAVRRAKEESAVKVAFTNGDISLLDGFTDEFDVLITQRCLINIPVFAEQAKAVEMIHNSLKRGGYYIMLEASKDGLDRLNGLRAEASLEDLKMPWHNNYFDIKTLESELERHFSILRKRDFSVYYLYTRILNESLGLDKNDALSKNIDETAVKIHRRFSDKFLGVGPQVLFFLKKK
jgi:ubiquinone/menaquinone biosynthesis C-methylase UbiE